MNHETQEALIEIMDIAPMYRRDYVMSYIRQNLPREEAKRLFVEKDKERFLNRMMGPGCTSVREILSMIGAEKVRQFLYSI